MDFNQPLDHATQDGLQFNGPSLDFLKETAKWTRFLSIVGFVFIGFMVLASFTIGSIFSAMPTGDIMPFPPIIFTVMYLLIAALYFFPILYLYRFSTSMLKAVDFQNQTDLEQAFSNLKSHYKFMGILTIIILGFYALMFLFGILGGAAAMLG